jgi:hypothetical protein
MTTDDKNPASSSDRTPESERPSPDPTAGTETALKGGSKQAKRLAERDWQNSSKEEGE